MKLKIKSGISVGDDKIILLGALGIMLLNTLPAISSTGEDPQVYEVDGEGNLLASPPKKNDYIKKAQKIISANDYAPIKTLYKLQSVFDDIAVISTLDYTQAEESTSSITDVLSDIRPYLSSQKREKVGLWTDNIRKTKKTFDQINSVKGKLSALPEQAAFKDRLKTILEEIPNLAGLPAIDEIINIKNLFLDSSGKNTTANQDKELSDNKNDNAEETKADYDDIYELMNMIGKKG